LLPRHKDTKDFIFYYYFLVSWCLEVGLFTKPSRVGDEVDVMKWSIDRKLLFFLVGLLAIILGAGCAGHRPQVWDEGVKIETSDGVRVAETTEKPVKKVFVDDKGAIEVVSTPFGYVKQRIKQPEEESSTPALEEPPVSSAPEVRLLKNRERKRR